MSINEEIKKRPTAEDLLSDKLVGDYVLEIFDLKLNYVSEKEKDEEIKRIKEEKDEEIKKRDEEIKKLKEERKGKAIFSGIYIFVMILLCSYI
jgi:hypothetical protein